MLCQKCGLKEAVVHVVCVVNDKQIDKWLCSDCVEELAPSNFLSGTVFNAKEFLDGLLKPKARKELFDSHRLAKALGAASGKEVKPEALALSFGCTTTAG